jgi:hypothetical protein
MPARGRKDRLKTFVEGELVSTSATLGRLNGYLLKKPRWF